MSAIQATKPFLTWVLIKAHSLSVSHWWMGWSKFLSIKYVTPEPKEDLKVSSFFFGVVVVSHSVVSDSSVHGILQAKILQWVAIFSSRVSYWPRDRTLVSCIGRQILYHWATWKAHEYIRLFTNMIVILDGWGRHVSSEGQGTNTEILPNMKCACSNLTFGD